MRTINLSAISKVYAQLVDLCTDITEVMGSNPVHA